MKYELGTLCSRLSSGKNISAKLVHSLGKYPVYGGNGLRGYTDSCNFEGECAIVGRQGAFCGNVRYFNGTAYMTEHAVVVCANKNNNTRYLAYLLSTMQLGRLSGQSAQPGLSVKTLSKQIVDVPPLEIQSKIACILRSFDEKIEQNNAINDNLQQQAQTLFKKWFICKNMGFKDVSLSTLMSYAGGSQPPASEFIATPRDGYVRFVQIRDYETDGHITYIPISSKNKLCEETDIMIARYGASLGRICFGLNGAYNVALAKVFPKKPYYREFLRCYLSSRDFYEGINNRGGRSAQAGFNESDIRSFILSFPCDDMLVREFENTASPMFAQRLSLLKENRKLVGIRDTLLPKLMSGEIDVSEVEV